MDDKKIEISQVSHIHRLIARMPEAAREYGLWVINGSVGDISRRSSFDCSPDRQFEFYSLSHMFSGKGKMRMGNRVWNVEAGDAVLVCPGDWHFYGGCDGNFYQEDAIRFCGRIPDFMRRNGLLRTSVLHIGAVRRLLPLIECSRSPAPDAWLKSALGLQELLLEFSRRNRQSPIESLLAAIDQAPPEYWWSVEELAELRGISCDRLRREFLRHTGMLPKAYLENCKLKLAAEYLISFTASVTDTARHFGYMDRYHFSRRFKHLFGVSPEQYRKLFSSRTVSGDTPRH